MAQRKDVADCMASCAPAQGHQRPPAFMFERNRRGGGCGQGHGDVEMLQVPGVVTFSLLHPSGQREREGDAKLEKGNSIVELCKRNIASNEPRAGGWLSIHWAKCV